LSKVADLFAPAHDGKPRYALRLVRSNPGDNISEDMADSIGGVVAADIARLLRERSNDLLMMAAKLDLGDQFAEATLEYKKVRLDPVYCRYLDVFRMDLQQAIKSEQVPPALSAKWSVESFEENIMKLQKDMFLEMQNALGDWLKVIDEMTVRAEVDQSMRDMIANFCTELYNDGRKIVESYAAVLVDADDAWRAAHPEEAKRFARV
jgi:hypothetical protein